MKKIFLLILFGFTFSTVFGQGIFFDPPTSTDVFYSDASGYITIPYHMWAQASYDVASWYARLTYPDGSLTNWNAGQSGGWYVIKAGTYKIEGQAYVYDIVLGGSGHWVHRWPFPFQCQDNLAPSIPQGITSSFQNSHPKITWTANTEHDINFYEIYKKKNSSVYSYYDQTSNNYYVDLQELQYTGGGNKDYVYYKIKAVDVNSNKSDLSASTRAAINASIEKGAFSNDKISKNIFKLFENYPNPFNPSTTISYQIPIGTYVTIKIYNTLGKEIAVLVNGFEESGKYSVVFDASKLKSGMYFYQLRAGSFSDVKKMVLTK